VGNRALSRERKDAAGAKAREQVGAGRCASTERRAMLERRGCTADNTSVKPISTSHREWSVLNAHPCQRVSAFSKSFAKHPAKIP
jgi:hypothetical protein